MCCAPISASHWRRRTWRSRGNPSTAPGRTSDVQSPSTSPAVAPRRMCWPCASTSLLCRSRQIRASNDLAVARAALNDALGVSLDRRFELTTPLDPAPARPRPRLKSTAAWPLRTSPEMRQAELAQRLARTQQQIAGAAYWPQVAFQGTSRPTRQNFLSKGGANWLTAVTLRWNLWNGGETKARVEQARCRIPRRSSAEARRFSRSSLEVRQGVPGSEGRRAARRSCFRCCSRGRRGPPHHPEPPPGRSDHRHRIAAQRDGAGRRTYAAPGGRL